MTFLLISRVNHSCAPNALFNFNDVLQKGTLEAVGGIACGEEITFNYGARGDREARQTFLRERFGFVCGCERCVGEQYN